MISCTSKSSVYLRWKYQQRVLYPSLHISWVFLPDHPGYLVRWVTPAWTHPIWCDDLQLSGTYVCFPTQGRLFCFPKPYFSEQYHTIFVGLFIKIYNTPPCSPKYYCNIWLYSILTEEEFNGTKTFFRTITWLVKAHRSMAKFFIPSAIKDNHTR